MKTGEKYIYCALIAMIFLLNGPWQENRTVQDRSIESPQYSLFESDQAATRPFTSSEEGLDNQTHRYIFLYSSPIDLVNNATLFTNFTNLGGTLLQGPWDEVNGFAGTINNSLSGLATFVAQFPPNFYDRDTLIEAQMNTVHEQLDLYPKFYDPSSLNLTGCSNASVAVLDSGIDITPPTFNSSYGELNFSKKIIAWKDLVDDNATTYDDNGHGTAMSSIIAGSSALNSSSNHTGDRYLMSIVQSVNHQNYFYPHYLAAGWYSIKLASFSMDENALDFLQLNLSVQIDSPMADFEWELYRDGEYIDGSQALADNLIWDTSGAFDSGLKAGLYDLLFTYKKTLYQNPIFTVHANISFTPQGYPRDIAEFSGIAPSTHLSSVKILDSTGKGWISTLISGLEYVYSNYEAQHILTTVISVASFEIPQNYGGIVSDMADLLIDSGVMVIFAAGNNGIENEINALGLNPRAIVVGAMNNLDQLTAYSAQGNTTDGREPDILAPGGSMLPGQEMVITADANVIDNGGETQDLISNDVSPVFGTSVAASIVGGVYNLIADYLGGWDTWANSLKRRALALKIKNYLLLTASETNTAREDNPYTPIDESLYSQVLNRGGTDRFEGYGRINPRAIINMLNNSINLNESYELDLASSAADSMAQHVFAMNITLEKDQMYEFNLINEENIFSSFDVDLYLYNRSGDSYGDPALVAASTQAGSGDETLFFTNLNTTDTFYVVVKAIAGEGTFSLNVTKRFLSGSPLLTNFTFGALSSFNYNDTLDTYRFQVNYSHIDDVPASHVEIVFPQLAKNYTLDQLSAFDTAYDEGVQYFGDIIFNSPGNYTFYFMVQTANYTCQYNLPNMTISVNSIHHFVGSAYNLNASSDKGLWDFEKDINSDLWFGSYLNVSKGWEKLAFSQEDDPRFLDGSQITWDAFYFGNSVQNTVFSPLTDPNNNKYYSYENIDGDYSLISPIFLLTESNDSLTVELDLGMRLSIDSADSMLIEISANRSAWTAIRSFSDVERDWASIKIDLEDYVGEYVQIRFRFQANSGLSKQYRQGVILDRFSIEYHNESRLYSPVLSAPFNVEDEILPLVHPASASRFDRYTFQVGYWDKDGDLPSEMYLEIDNKNYTMYNSYGIWETGEFSNSSINQIIYTAEIYVSDFKNYTYRFICKDGGIIVSTARYQLSPSIESDLGDFPYDFNDIGGVTSMVGYPANTSYSTWIEANRGWHMAYSNRSTSAGQELYCGLSDLLGYGQGYDTTYYTPIINLNGTNEVFLYLDQRIRFDSEGNDGDDYGEILISLDYGDSWKQLVLFDEQTPGVTFQSMVIDLTEYISQDVMLGFHFMSDDSGERVQRSGWQIRDYYIGINTTKDYDVPQIIFGQLQDGDTISGDYNLTITIVDASALDLERTEFWLDNQLTEVTIVNNTINILIHTRDYSNGDWIEIIIVAYDIEGNRGFDKVSVRVHNSPTALSWFFILFSSVVGFAAIAYFSARSIKIRNLKRKGTYIRKPSIFERIQQRKFVVNKIRDEAEIIVDKIDRDWEKAQPMKLYCHKCDKLYLSPEFELYCPHCLRPSLFIAKYCPACKIWNYFEEEGARHQCKKCGLPLLKDFDNAKEYLINQAEAPETMGHLTPEDLNTIENITQKLSPDEIGKLLGKLTEKSQERTDE